MVKTYGSRFTPSPNLAKVTVSFDKLNNTDLFLQKNQVYILYANDLFSFPCTITLFWRQPLKAPPANPQT